MQNKYNIPRSLISLFSDRAVSGSGAVMEPGYRGNCSMNTEDRGGRVDPAGRRTEPQCCCWRSSSLWRQPTAVMRAAPLPLPSSESRKVTSHLGASSFTDCCMILEKL